MSKRLAASTVAALAIAAAGCSESTAPAKSTPRTVSVSTSATVPAVPTAPITLATNATESQVSVTLPATALQNIVQALGGPVSITMTDVAPADVASKLPAGSSALIDASKTAALILFDAQRSGASSLADLTSEMILAQVGGNVDIPFRFKPFSAGCTAGSFVGFTLQNSVRTVRTITVPGLANGFWSFSYTIPLPFFVRSFVLGVECTPVSGSFSP
jgi:hypothetical protein